MISDTELKRKFETLSNKLKAGLFEDVIIELKLYLKKENIRYFLIYFVSLIKI